MDLVALLVSARQDLGGEGVHVLIYKYTGRRIAGKQV